MADETKTKKVRRTADERARENLEARKAQLLAQSARIHEQQVIIGKRLDKIEKELKRINDMLGVNAETK